MHSGVGDVLHWDSYVPFPDQYLLIVTRGNHFRVPIIFLNKRDGVDGCQVMIVFLRDVRGFAIVGYYFVVAGSHDEKVIILRIKFNTIRYLFVPKRLQYLSTFGIPEPQKPIERSGHKFAAVVIELNVSHACLVSFVGPQDLPFSRFSYGPYLALSVKAGAQQQVTGLWEKSYSLNTLVVSGVTMDTLLRDETFVIVHSFLNRG
mmetsp:Transcript_10132/g.24589  ORF Transcript_10132/g.24589 Transcript_10132/m.24589 type:complete len:204 (+) Transcript_10132:425-1036(+)